MNAAGFNTGAKLPPPAGCVRREKSPDGIMWLYDRAQGVPKREISEAQKAALQKANEMARIVEIRCSKCGVFIEEVTAKKAKDTPPQPCFVCRDGESAEQGARELLENGCVIMDTETTGLYDAEIVQIAIINQRGETLLNTLVKPDKPEKMLVKSDSGICAFDIHGIHPDALTDAPTLSDLYPQLYEILKDQTLVIYNSDFDFPILRRMLRAWHCPMIPLADVDCAMELYAQWYGEWSSYHESYRWQPLPGGDHTALGDCLATLEVIKRMARSDDTENG
jgi:DNA polymerase III epsilon subunit-like protein